MAASLFQICRVLCITVVILPVVTGVNATRNFSDPQNESSLNMTHTRFIAARWGSKVTFSCPSGTNLVKKVAENKNWTEEELKKEPRINITNNSTFKVIKITKLQYADSGIYFCKSAKEEEKKCCGTELRVMGVSSFEQVKNRNNLKDTIILIQTILLVLFVSIPVFLTLGKGDGRDMSAEDHTYEGLTVELADTYEDIGNYQDKTEKWDLGEHPCEE
ncbi:B-cell antigen receptor complex-associated protein beta chain [Hemicordylus capensis]|uniref:B-cell antigen receptor complex-associated protein beta chain n=1 Tax=Hemicordylus capensis TaxID=884348 RepID=UPI00230324CE|nr:B-cell antigen receptor complex-associated protein beta chain [Hemicordylus capensis]